MTDLRFLSKLDGKFKNSPRRGVLFRCYGFFINILHDFLPFLACIVAGMTENKKYRIYIYVMLYRNFCIEIIFAIKKSYGRVRIFLL